MSGNRSDSDVYGTASAFSFEREIKIKLERKKSGSYEFFVTYDTREINRDSETGSETSDSVGVEDEFSMSSISSSTDVKEKGKESVKRKRLKGKKLEETLPQQVDVRSDKQKKTQFFESVEKKAPREDVIPSFEEIESNVCDLFNKKKTTIQIESVPKKSSFDQIMRKVSDLFNKKKKTKKNPIQTESVPMTKSREGLMKIISDCFKSSKQTKAATSKIQPVPMTKSFESVLSHSKERSSHENRESLLSNHDLSKNTDCMLENDKSTEPESMIKSNDEAEKKVHEIEEMENCSELEDKNVEMKPCDKDKHHYEGKISSCESENKNIGMDSMKSSDKDNVVEQNNSSVKVSCNVTNALETASHAVTSAVEKEIVEFLGSLSSDYDKLPRSLSRKACSSSLTAPSTVRTLSKRRNRRKIIFFSRSVQLEENFGTPSQRRLRVPRRRKKREIFSGKAAENNITFERKFSPLNLQSKRTITSKCVASTLSQAKLSILQFGRKLNQTNVERRGNSRSSHRWHGLTQMRPKSTTSLEVEGQVSCSSRAIESTGTLFRRRFISPQESTGSFPHVRLSCRLSCPLFRKEVTLSKSSDNSEECMSQSESEMKQTKQHDLQKDDTKLKVTASLEVERQASSGTPMRRRFSSFIKMQNSNNQKNSDTKSVRMSLLGVERQTSRRTLSYRRHRLQKDTMTSSNSDTNSKKDIAAHSNLQAKHTTAISARPNSEQCKLQSGSKVEKTQMLGSSKLNDALNMSDTKPKDKAKLKEANTISEEVARPECATSQDNSKLPKSQCGSKVDKAEMQSTSKFNVDAAISDGVALPSYTLPPSNSKQSESGVTKQKPNDSLEAGDTKPKGKVTLEVEGQEESPTNSDTVCYAQSPKKATSELPSSSEIGSRSGSRSKEKKAIQVEASNTSTKMDSPLVLHEKISCSTKKTQSDEISGTLTSTQRSDTTTSEQCSASETDAKKSKSQSKSKPAIQVARGGVTDKKCQSKSKTEVTSEVTGEDSISDGTIKKHQSKENQKEECRS